MKYSLQVFVGTVALTAALVHTSEFEAASDHEAVDAARATHDVPEEGGSFLLVLTALDEGPIVKIWQAVPGDPAGRFVDAPRPVGEICRFGVTHEPAAHLREALEAVAAEAKSLADAAALKDQHRQELLAELGIDAEQAAKMLKGVSK